MDNKSLIRTRITNWKQPRLCRTLCRYYKTQIRLFITFRSISLHRHALKSWLNCPPTQVQRDTNITLKNQDIAREPGHQTSYRCFSIHRPIFQLTVIGQSIRLNLAQLVISADFRPMGPVEANGASWGKWARVISAGSCYMRPRIAVSHALLFIRVGRRNLEANCGIGSSFDEVMFR